MQKLQNVMIKKCKDCECEVEKEIDLTGSINADASIFFSTAGAVHCQVFDGENVAECFRKTVQFAWISSCYRLRENNA